MYSYIADRVCCSVAAVAHCKYEWLKLTGAQAKSSLVDGLLMLSRDVNKDFSWRILIDALSYTSYG